MFRALWWSIPSLGISSAPLPDQKEHWGWEGAVGAVGGGGVMKAWPTASVGFLLSGGCSSSWLTGGGWGWMLAPGSRSTPVARWKWIEGPCWETRSPLVSSSQQSQVSNMSGKGLLTNPTHKIYGRQWKKFFVCLFVFKYSLKHCRKNVFGKTLFAQINADVLCFLVSDSTKD